MVERLRYNDPRFNTPLRSASSSLSSVGAASGGAARAVGQKRARSSNDELDDLSTRFGRLGSKLARNNIETLLDNYRGRGSLLDAFI